MNTKELKKIIKSSGKPKRHGYGYLKDGTLFQVDEHKFKNNSYVITVYDKRKPQFKIGKKTFIVS